MCRHSNFFFLFTNYHSSDHSLVAGLLILFLSKCVSLLQNSHEKEHNHLKKPNDENKKRFYKSLKQKGKEIPTVQKENRYEGISAW